MDFFPTFHFNFLIFFPLILFANRLIFYLALALALALSLEIALKWIRLERWECDTPPLWHVSIIAHLHRSPPSFMPPYVRPTVSRMTRELTHRILSHWLIRSLVHSHRHLFVCTANFLHSFVCTAHFSAPLHSLACSLAHPLITELMGKKFFFPR